MKIKIEMSFLVEKFYTGLSRVLVKEHCREFVVNEISKLFEIRLTC